MAVGPRSAHVDEGAGHVGQCDAVGDGHPLLPDVDDVAGVRFGARRPTRVWVPVNMDMYVCSIYGWRNG